MLKKIGGSFVLAVIGLLVDMAGLALVIRVVGKEGYGIAGLFMSLLSLIGFVEVGLGAFVTKSLSDQKGKLTTENVSRILSSGAYGLGGLALITCVVVGIFVLFFFGSVFSIQPSIFKHLLLSRLLIVGILAESFAIAFLNRILQGTHSFERTRISAIAIELFRFAMLYTFLSPTNSMEYNINLMLTLRFLTYLLTIIFYTQISRKALGVRISLSFANIDKKQLRDSLTFSSPIIGSKLISRLQSIGGVWIIGAFIGPSETAVLLIAQRVYQGMADLAGSLLVTIFPISSSLHAQNKESMAGFWLNGTHYNMALTTVLAAATTCTIGPLVKFFLHTDFKNLTLLVFIYGCVVIIGGIYGLGNEILIGVNRHHRTFWNYIVFSIISIIFQLTLGYKFGLVGIPLGLATGLLYFCIQSLRLQLHHLGTNPKGLLSSIFINLGIYLFILLTGFYALPLQSVNSLLEFIIWGTLFAGIIVSVTYIFLIQSKEKKLIREFVRNRSRLKGP